MCRSYFVFVASLSFRQDTSALLAIFYPDKHYFYTSLVIAIPALFALLFVSFRERLWQRAHYLIFKLIKPLILIGLLVDVLFHVAMAERQYWQFSWLIAATVLLDCLCLFFVLRDKHIDLMLKDWGKPTIE
jgi:hypothetical protein